MAASRCRRQAAVSTSGTMGSSALALTTIWSSVTARPATAPRRGEPLTRALMTSTWADATRAIDDPMTRLICRTRSLDATSAAISWPISARISTSASVKATSPGRGTG